MYAAILFVGIQNASSIQPVASIERTVFYREKAAGMYSPMAYAFAQVKKHVVHFKKPSVFHYVWALHLKKFTIFLPRFSLSSHMFLCKHLLMASLFIQWWHLNGLLLNSYGIYSSCISHYCTSPSLAWCLWVWHQTTTLPQSFLLHFMRFGISSQDS